MLELHKIIQVSHVVAYPIFLFCFMSKVGRKECSEL